MKNTGDDYFDSDEFHQLLDTYEAAVNAGEPVFMDADELVDIADYYQYTDRKDEAEKAITLALSLAPGDCAPLTYRIHEALFQGNPQKAWELLEQIIDKDQPDYIYDRAEILVFEGRIEEADHYLKEHYLTIPPEEQQDFVVDVANIFTEYGQPEKAMLWMEKAKQEDSVDFKELMARTLFGMGKYKDSQRIFNELIDANPFSKNYWNALASAQFMNEDYSEAIQSSEYAIAIDPDDPESLLAKANGLYRLNNYEEAQKFYQRYQELVPYDEFALLYEGTCLINMQKSEQAIDVLQKALELAPDDSPYLYDIYQELAFAYAENHEVDKALEVLDKTDTLDCDHVQLSLIRGHILLGANRMDEAKKFFHQAVEISETPKQTLLRVIVSFYDNRYLEGAYTLFKKFFAHYDQQGNGQNTEGYAYMALCCYDMQNYKEFLNYLQKACKVNPKECRVALSHMFPEEIKSEDYYQYIKDKLNIKD
jgi:tetratricopeptide (TPR) repeat protein